MNIYLVKWIFKNVLNIQDIFEYSWYSRGSDPHMHLKFKYSQHAFDSEVALDNTVCAWLDHIWTTSNPPQNDSISQQTLTYVTGGNCGTLDPNSCSSAHQATWTSRKHRLTSSTAFYELWISVQMVSGLVRDLECLNK